MGIYKNNWFIYSLIFLVIFCFVILRELPDNNVHLISCDVGQGDAILIIYKSIQILTDGGNPNGMASSCLSRHIPFWDRTIEAVVITHPHLDHYGGIIEIFKKYKISNFFASDTKVGDQEYGVLLNAVGREGTRVVRPSNSTSISVGLMSYDMFYPTDKSIEDNLNDISIQSMVTVGNFEALLTGDIEQKFSAEVLDDLPIKSVEYIKVPHHGSRNSMLEDYLKVIDPKLAVISVGKKNRYGHPALEIIKMLEAENVKILRTDLMGDIEVVTDGVNYWVEN